MMIMITCRLAWTAVFYSFMQIAYDHLTLRSAICVHSLLKAGLCTDVCGCACMCMFMYTSNVFTPLVSAAGVWTCEGADAGGPVQMSPQGFSRTKSATHENTQSGEREAALGCSHLSLPSRNAAWYWTTGGLCFQKRAPRIWRQLCRMSAHIRLMFWGWGGFDNAKGGRGLKLILWFPMKQTSQNASICFSKEQFPLRSLSAEMATLGLCYCRVVI